MPHNTDDLVLTTKEKREFFNSLFVLYKSGIPMVDAMKRLSDKAKSHCVSDMSKYIYKDLMRGTPFDRAVKKFEKSLGKVYTGLLISGDKSGKLIVVLSRIQNLLQKENHIKNKVLAALTYPAIVMVMVIAVSCLFAFFVFPMLDGGGQVNIMIQAFSALIKTGIVFAIIIGILVFLKKIHFVDKRLIPALINLPKIGEIVQSANLANFFLVMSVAYDGGLSAVETLELASETIKQPDIKQKLRRSLRHLMDGKEFSASLTMEDALPDDYIASIATGETTGELDKALAEIIDEIDESTELAINSFSQLLQPVMLIFAGIVVGALLVACYGKMYSDLF